jgi:hypothetical protein
MKELASGGIETGVKIILMWSMILRWAQQDSRRKSYIIIMSAIGCMEDDE